MEAGGSRRAARRGLELDIPSSSLAATTPAADRRASRVASRSCASHGRAPRPQPSRTYTRHRPYGM